MLFNTLTYAYFFVAVFVISWLLAPWRRLRLAFLLISSYVFYAGWTFVGCEKLLGAWRAEQWGEFAALAFDSIKYVPLLFVATSIDFLLGVALGAIEDKRLRKLMLIGTVLVNVGILVFFKYWNWGVDTLNWLSEIVGVQLPDITSRFELPIGISFFCFMSLSYVVDVYRKTIPACRSYLDYLTYISFFPHLVAGPIIRGRDLLPHLARKTRLTSKVGGEGLFLICAGLIKKVAIGDYLALNLVDRVFADPASYSAVEVMSAMYGYAVQVYCDFSGYSDIAIGSALLLGYRFKINFDAPFKSLNIVEFWRRWHISLSTWLRDYVYFSMGGGRVGKLRKYFNIFMTMVVCGVWHGAAWTFVIFGCIQGVALSVSHWFREERKQPGLWRKALVALAISVLLWLIIGAVSWHYDRPGLALMIGLLIAGGWLVAFTIWLAERVEGPVKKAAIGVAPLLIVGATLLWLGWSQDSMGFAIAGLLVHLAGWLILIATASFKGLQKGNRAQWPLRILCIAANFTFVGLTFTMFRAQTLELCWAMYERILTFTTYTPNLHAKVLAVIFAALVLQWAPRRVYDWARERFIAAPAPVQALVLFGVAWILREAASADAQPFVYFQF